jgi:hypothetical protein
MSGKQSKKLRRHQGLDKDPKNKILVKNYRRLKKVYTKLTKNQKTEFNKNE